MVDLRTGHQTIERPELTDAFRTAVAPYLLPRQTAPWRDLALNRPGQAVREKAADLHAEMQKRSRIGAFILRAVDAKTDERAFRVGATGEETVGSRLDRLTKHGWHVLHSVPVGSRCADIDHVLIGLGGVYTINTKHHPGSRVSVGKHTIRVNGQRTDYLRNSRYEAQRTRTLLRRVTQGLSFASSMSGKGARVLAEMVTAWKQGVGQGGVQSP